MILVRLHRLLKGISSNANWLYILNIYLYVKLYESNEMHIIIVLVGNVVMI